MEKELLEFIQFDVIYIRQGVSNNWTRRVERKAAATKEIGVPMVIIHHQDESVKDEKRVICTVNVKCDPLINDPNTFMVPEDLKPYEEEALQLTDKKFKKRHPEAEFTP